MNIAGINYESFSDGVGCRTVIFVSGCEWNCKGCHNPQTHDFNYGIKLTGGLFSEIISEINKRPFISGITISGGDPMNPYNIVETSLLIHNLKSKFPNKNIWVYTGYTYEYLYEHFYFSLTNIDVLVDGKFEIDKRDITLKFCGSSNQRIIDVQKSLKTNKVILMRY